MKILAIETSGPVAGAAVLEDDMLIAEYALNYKMTHSQTIMPITDEILRRTETDPATLDYIACSSGPGSFTGLRIGAATAKGLALALSIPVVPVPTLDSLAYNIFNHPGIICPVMDARRSELYTGFYTWRAGKLQRIGEPAALPKDEVMKKAASFGETVVFLGDGVKVIREKISEKPEFISAPGSLNMQRASSVAALAMEIVLSGRIPPFEIDYLRKSQAERELACKKGLGDI